MKKNIWKIESSIPIEIKTKVYYAINNGKILFDVESMENDFDLQVQELKEKYCDK